MDRVDGAILALLQENADLPLAEIAEQVNLSTTPCWRRIQRLEEQGYIKRRVALLDPAKLNVGVLRVVVPDIAAYDKVYKKLTKNIEIFDVSSSFAMEEIKHTTALPLDYLICDK